MIKALVMTAALLGSTAAIAQNSMGNMSGDMMSNGSMSTGSMSTGSTSTGAMTPPSTDMNNHASHAASGGDSPTGAMDRTGGMTPASTDMNNHASHAAPGGLPNADKCAAAYKSYNPSTGMYMTRSGKQMSCKL